MDLSGKAVVNKKNCYSISFRARYERDKFKLKYQLKSMNSPFDGSFLYKIKELKVLEGDLTIFDVAGVVKLHIHRPTLKVKIVVNRYSHYVVSTQVSNVADSNNKIYFHSENIIITFKIDLTDQLKKK